MDGVIDGVTNGVTGGVTNNGWWRNVPILVLALLGVGWAGQGVRLFFRGVGSPSPDARTLLSALRGFRLAVIGLALVGVAGAWWWGEVWLLVLSLGIAGEETLETSLMIWALKQEHRSCAHGRRRPLPRRPSAGIGVGQPTSA